MNKIVRQIILLVANAQRHSDEGKVLRNSRNWYYEGDTQEVIAFSKNYGKYGYDGKTQAILAAIALIDKHPYMGVSYYVKDDGNSVILYFNLKLDGKRYQVSFHAFESKLRKLAGKGSPCRWEKKMSSRETCQELLRLCGEESYINVE